MAVLPRIDPTPSNAMTNHLARLLGSAAVLLVACAVLAAPASAASVNSHSWTPPYHGKFVHSVSVSTGSCPGSRNTTIHSVPTFNQTTGVGHMDLESNTSGTFCPHAQSRSSLQDEFGYKTRAFALALGKHSVVVTWSLRWYADLTSVGGHAGRSTPTLAKMGIGVNGTQLCNTANGLCLLFPKSSAHGSGHSVGWSTNVTVANSTSRAFGSVTVNLYLNGTFGGAGKFVISSMLYAFTEARSYGAADHSQALLLFNSILGGNVSLKGITIS
jgi:hypothetical protein